MFSVKMVRAMSIFMVFVLFSVVLIQDVAFAETDLEAKLEKTKEDIVGLLQQIARIVAVLVVAFAGFVLLFKSGEPDAMRWLKSSAVVFLAAIAVLFLAEPIANAITGFFGTE